MAAASGCARRYGSCQSLNLRPAEPHCYFRFEENARCRDRGIEDHSSRFQPSVHQIGRINFPCNIQ